MRRTPTALAFTSLALLLASCAGTSTPDAQGDLIQLRLGHAAPISSQGLPTGGFTPAGAFLKVKVANSQGELVTFNNGVYAPNGQGDTFLTLNMTNGFGTTVLLPKGNYTFETVAKDGLDEQATTGTLLAYSKTPLTTVDASNNSVKLTVRTVMNPAATALNFKLPTDVVYTNDVLDLRLNVKTHSVGGQAYSVPTTDFSIGQYVATHGTLTTTGSKLGVSVRATGTAADPRLAVTVPVTGWVQTGPETAAQQIVNVTFEHAVNASTVSADVLAPSATMTTTTAYLNAVSSVQGTAQDEGGAVAAARLYDGTTLIASTDASEQSGSVSALTFADGTSNWQAQITPHTLGAHTLTLIASDAAGNETTVEQSMQVSAAAVITPNGGSSNVRTMLQPGETRQFLYDAPAGSTYHYMYVIDGAFWDGGYDCYAGGRLEISAVSAATGTPLDLPYAYGGCYRGLDQSSDQDVIFTVKNTSGTAVSVNHYFDAWN